MTIGVTGHQRLTPQTARAVEASVEGLLSTQTPPLRGVSSLAEGADQIFASVILRLGGFLDVILPSREYRTTFDDEAVARNYDSLLSRAATRTILPFTKPTEEAFMAAGREIVRRSQLLIAIWDGQAARGYGGTADVVAYARSLDVPVEVVWPAGARRAVA